MNFFWTRLRVALILENRDRTKYMKEHNIFAGIGDNCSFQPRLIPLDAKYIKLHNNVHVASNVTFIAHDVMQKMFNYIDDGEPTLPRFKGCIELMDNVFIGTNTSILPNVKIGPNAIVAAGSLVNKDVPPGTIVGGVPARVIGSFDDLYKKRLDEFKEYGDIYSNPEKAWEHFNKIKNNNS